MALQLNSPVTSNRIFKLTHEDTDMNIFEGNRVLVQKQQTQSKTSVLDTTEYSGVDPNPGGSKVVEINYTSATENEKVFYITITGELKSNASGAMTMWVGGTLLVDIIAPTQETAVTYQTFRSRLLVLRDDSTGLIKTIEINLQSPDGAAVYVKNLQIEIVLLSEIVQEVDGSQWGAWT